MMSTEAKEETKRSEEAPKAAQGQRQAAQAPSPAAGEAGQGAGQTKLAVEPKKKAPQLTEKAKQVVEAIKAMSVLELAEVAKFLKEEFGISDAVPMAVAGVPGGAAAAGGGEAAEEKTSFDVILAEVGANKIQVIKELRTVTTLGLKEAKDLVDAAPKPVKTGATKEEAENIKKKLEAAGAKVQLK